MGDGLKTGEGAHADLEFLPDGQMRIAEQTLIRFLNSAPEKPPRVQVDSGNIQLETTTMQVEISTSQGVARISRGAKVNIDASGTQTQFFVRVGSIEAIKTGQVATAGQRLTLEIGAITAEDIDELDDGAPEISKPERESPAALDAPEASLSASNTPTAVRFAPATSPAAFKLETNRAITVHDPTPPTRVGFRIPTCQKDSVFEIKRNGRWARSDANSRHVAILGTGNYLYRGRCSEAKGEPKIRGRIAIRRDAATRRLPRGAPTTTLETDGRKYHVEYQNRLPSLRFVWPKAPESSSYSLELTSQSGAVQERPTSKTANFKLSAGTLDEGKYRFRIRTAGSRSSLTSTLEISFDNGARTAFLSAPVDNGFEAGNVVQISGAALAGAKVSTRTGKIKVSRSGRFAGTATVGANTGVLIVQVQHPRSGTHYYLRRPRQPE